MRPVTPSLRIVGTKNLSRASEICHVEGFLCGTRAGEEGAAEADAARGSGSGRPERATRELRRDCRRAGPADARAARCSTMHEPNLVLARRVRHGEGHDAECAFRLRGPASLPGHPVPACAHPPCLNTLVDVRKDTRCEHAGAAKRTSVVKVPTNVTTDELIDELKAIAGNDGERVNQVEGRETAAEYSRRVKETIKAREAEEQRTLARAMEALKAVDITSPHGCTCASELLCQALAEGVLTNALALASTVLHALLSSSPAPTIPSSPLAAEEAERHEAASFQTLESAARAFIGGAAGGGGGGDADGNRRARLCMWLGAVFLNVFVSGNWTGPPMKDLPISPCPWHADVLAGSSTVVGKANATTGTSAAASATAAGKAGAGGAGGATAGGGGSEAQEALEAASKRALERDSEMFFRGAVAPMYLRAALSLLVNIEYPAPPPTLAWWAARALGTQQRLLLGKSASLHSALFQQWELASEHMKLSLAAAADAYLQVLNPKP
jgi:hypothetical protein